MRLFHSGQEVCTSPASQMSFLWGTSAGRSSVHGPHQQVDFEIVINLLHTLSLHYTSTSKGKGHPVLKAHEVLREPIARPVTILLHQQVEISYSLFIPSSLSCLSNR